MWSKGAVVVVKRGDTALADMIANGDVFKSKSVEELKNIERNYTMRKNREKEYWEAKFASVRRKYRNIGKKQEDNWQARIEVIWACVFNQVYQAAHSLTRRFVR